MYGRCVCSYRRWLQQLGLHQRPHAVDLDALLNVAHHHAAREVLLGGELAQHEQRVVLDQRRTVAQAVIQHLAQLLQTSVRTRVLEVRRSIHA